MCCYGFSFREIPNRNHDFRERRQLHFGLFLEGRCGGVGYEAGYVWRIWEGGDQIPSKMPLKM